MAGHPLRLQVIAVYLLSLQHWPVLGIGKVSELCEDYQRSIAIPHAAVIEESCTAQVWTLTRAHAEGSQRQLRADRAEHLALCAIVSNQTQVGLCPIANGELTS